jgi:beta-1,2-xylosyltransferase
MYVLKLHTSERSSLQLQSDLYDSTLEALFDCCSDISSVMAFFVGTPDGRGNHDRIANRLAENGRHWAGRYVSPSGAKRWKLTSLQWRRNDMASYMYRLILEWARIIHDGGDVDYVPPILV